MDRKWFENAQSSCAKKEYRTKVWKILNEDIKIKFSEKVEVLYNRCDERDAWLKYKSSTLKAAEEVCGVSRDRPQHEETWWWNQEVQKAISEKGKNFRRWKKLPLTENKSCYPLPKESQENCSLSNEEKDRERGRKYGMKKTSYSVE